MKYAMFKENQYEDILGLIYKKDELHEITKEDDKYYYIKGYENNIVCWFDKKDEGIVFEIIER